jgi:hypothetical protein
VSAANFSRNSRGFEEQVTRAVGPGPLELHQHASVRQQPQTFLGERRPQQVATETLEPRTVVARHAQVGVEVEALEVHLTRSHGDDPRRIRLRSQAPDARAGATPERDPAEHRRARDARQHRRLLDERVPRRLGVQPEPAALEQAQHPCPHGGDRVGDVGVARCRRRVKHERLAGRRLDEDAVEHERVEVDVQIEPAAEALNDGQGARVAVTESALRGLAPVVVEHGPREDTEHRPAQLVVPRQQVAQPIREAQDPLPHVADEIGELRVRTRDGPRRPIGLPGPWSA